MVLRVESESVGGSADGGRDGASDDLDLDPMYVAAVAAFLASDAGDDITGRIIHAAGGAIREYTTRRTSQSALVSRPENGANDSL